MFSGAEKDKQGAQTPARLTCLPVAECLSKAGWVQAQIHLPSCGSQLPYQGPCRFQFQSFPQPHSQPELRGKLLWKMKLLAKPICQYRSLGLTQTGSKGDHLVMQLQFAQCGALFNVFCLWENNFRNGDRFKLAVAQESM